jgi:hypothetical protein
MSLSIVTAASDPSFYMRVSFAALKIAQKIVSEPSGPNSKNRVGYANRILTGNDNAILLAQHVATDAVVGKALEDGGAERPLDVDIERSLLTLWNARANAYFAPGMWDFTTPDPTPPPVKKPG